MLDIEQSSICTKSPGDVANGSEKMHASPPAGIDIMYLSFQVSRFGAHTEKIGRNQKNLNNLKFKASLRCNNEYAIIDSSWSLITLEACHCWPKNHEKTASAGACLMLLDWKHIYLELATHAVCIEDHIFSTIWLQNNFTRDAHMVADWRKDVISNPAEAYTAETRPWCHTSIQKWARKVVGPWRVLMGHQCHKDIQSPHKNICTKHHRSFGYRKRGISHPRFRTHENSTLWTSIGQIPFFS